ncbi:flagellar motor protein MotB [Metabacillus iocasae]|uniref:Chemotaxis protein MotB n=1 Tax=Priestia iocasae TaxID=2291674 RepID=A0ABS2QY43_9BACI|nr:chemotaxis protein MotB [Metabacillus iocasae]
MSKRRAKKKEDEHIDESWLIPYADLLTLLLALFIVLFSVSTVDAKKFQQLSQVFNGIVVGGNGVFEFQSPLSVEPLTIPMLDEVDKEKIDETKEENEHVEEAEDKEKKEDKTEVEKKKDRAELDAVQRKINDYIVKKNLTHQLSTLLTDEGLLLTINDGILFDSGRTEIRKENKQLAKEIAKLLVIHPPRNIIISGHTDNVPIRTKQFKSNWELSVMRAVEFMKLLLENKQLDPAFFSAKGYGEYQPIKSNQTREGRAKNRRVEVLILPRTK